MRRSLTPSQIQKRINPTESTKRPRNDSIESKRKITRKTLQEIPINTSLTIYVTDHEAIIKKLSQPFKCPIANYEGSNTRKNLGIRRVQMKRALYDPNTPNALVLYEPPEIPEHEKIKMKDGPILVHVVVDPLLSNILRPHQREGVKFMYDCVTGKQIENYYGCIMADEMGLGKTLQCITLLWTLIKQGPDCKPIIEKAIIVCPSSLVKNWSNEIDKWLKSRLLSISMDGGSSTESKKKLEQFVHNRGRGVTPILIISYETLRINQEILRKGEIGLIICDEGHRLKNSENQTYQSLQSLNTKRRILLSGTPIQNDLQEYYNLINFVNNNLLGNVQEFRKNYELQIIKGQDSLATTKERNDSQLCLTKLNDLVNKFMIRRTSNLLTKYLPIKFEMILIIQLTEEQKLFYKNLINSDWFKKTIDLNDKSGGNVLGMITTLKKLCNHPELIADKLENYPLTNDIKIELSSKFMLLDYMLIHLKTNYNDKIVLVSNYTQTLDLFEKLCKKRSYLYVRLDGKMSIKKRGDIVKKFNEKDSREFIFMLSSKAGGCGLNLIGANRLIMFDPDWNPANDDQAMARVWRDGQEKPCFIYRFLTAGTIEEKIFQRQTYKKGLSSTVVDQNDEFNSYFNKNDLKELFKFEKDTRSDTHDKLKCKRCLNFIQVRNPSSDSDCLSDLGDWYHCWDKKFLDDLLLKQIWDLSKYISFVFYQKSSCQIVKSIKENDEDYKEEEEKDDEDYSD